MEYIIIIIMVLGASSIMGLLWSICNDKDILTFVCFILAEICIISISLIALNIYSNKEIPAIEAYRGNTALQITCQDGIPIDSIVVYKLNK